MDRAQVVGVPQAVVRQKEPENESVCEKSLRVVNGKLDQVAKRDGIAPAEKRDTAFPPTISSIVAPATRVGSFRARIIVA